MRFIIGSGRISYGKYNLKFRVQTLTKNFRFTTFIINIHLLKIS